MKHIVKQSEPPVFSEWKAMASDDWKPDYDDNFSGSVKRVVKKSLMAEQGYICCYCERRLTGNDSHIEHFKPQSDPDVDSLDYSNMLCSCQNRLKKGEPRHCGNLKGDWFDEKHLISPFNSSCEQRFIYTANGGIRPGNEDDKAAFTTMKNLGLDIPKLTDLRAKAIEPFLEADLTSDELKAFVTGYLQMTEEGMFGEFYTTILYLFGGQAWA